MSIDVHAAAPVYKIAGHDKRCRHSAAVTTVGASADVADSDSVAVAASS